MGREEEEGWGAEAGLGLAVATGWGLGEWAEYWPAESGRNYRCSRRCSHRRRTRLPVAWY